MVELPKPTINCGITQAAILVVAHYKGGVKPISGVNVTLSLKSYLPGLADTQLPLTPTDSNGMTQTCINYGRGVGVRIQKNDIDFGNGVGVSYDIASRAGGAGSYTFSKDALTLPPLPKLPSVPSVPKCTPPYILDPLTGRCVLIGKPVCVFPEIYDPITNRCISPPQCIGAILATVPDFKQALDSPTLPTSIPMTVNTTVNKSPKSIPLAILVDNREISSANGNSSIDILSLIRSIGSSAINTGHQIRIESRLKDCDIQPFSFNVPALIPSIIPGGCVEGETKTIRCPDSTEIIIAVCRKDPVTGFNAFVPTGNQCPIPQAPELGKQVKILAYTPTAALEAYDGQEVTITAAVTCGISMSNGEIAIFIVDGNEISRGTTNQGFVSFKWIATTDPSRTHKLCVSVPKSDQCTKYGEARDCKTITVSRVIPGIQEQLVKERKAYLSQLEASRRERDRIRDIKTFPELMQPPVIPPLIPTIPAVQPPPVPVPSTETPPAPTTGTISIPAVKIPPGVEFPIEIYIDGQGIGAPPISREVSSGTHTLRIQLKGFSPISMKVDVPAGGVKTIEESFL